MSWFTSLLRSKFTNLRTFDSFPQGRAAEVVAAGLRGNGERMRKWRENEEIEGKWREN